MTCVKAAVMLLTGTEGLQELRETRPGIAAPSHACRFGWGTELPSLGQPGVFSLIFMESRHGCPFRSV